MAKICQKCGFENIDQTFYCSRCGEQIAKLPPRPVENISQEDLIRSEKARARSDAMDKVIEGRLTGIWGLIGRLGGSDRATVSEKKFKKTLEQEKKADASSKTTPTSDYSTPMNQSYRPYDQSLPPQQQIPMLCPKCGKTSEGDAFCKYCGAEIK